MIDCLEKEQQSGGADGYGLRGRQPPQHQAANGTHFDNQSSSYQLQRQPKLIEVSPSESQQQADNELIGYYFGSISRDTAEWILKTHGNQADGAYLLRSSGPNDDFVLSLMVNHNQQQPNSNGNNLEVLHYKIVETEDSFVALHGQVGDEKFATIDELIDKAQGVATKPRWPMHRQYLESQILPPTYWGLTVDQIRLAILIKAKQWGFPLLSTLFQTPQQQQQADELQTSPNVESSATSATTLNNETIRTLIYKSLHEFQPWFHGKISRDEAERRIEEGHVRDGRFLVRERDNYSYAMCISHKKTTKHYRIDVLPTGELAIQDGRKFTSLMALVSHYTIMSDGLWCALTEACPRPIHSHATGRQMTNNGGPAVVQQQSAYSTAINTLRSYPPLNGQQNSMYYTAPSTGTINGIHNMILAPPATTSMIQSTMAPQPPPLPMANDNSMLATNYAKSKMTGDGQAEGAVNRDSNNRTSLICAQQGSVASLRGPIKEWLQTINHKWSQLMAAKNQHQSLNSFLFGNQNPLNNHCRHHHHMSPHHHHHRRKCKNGHVACACIHHQQQQMIVAAANCKLNQANDVTLARQPFMNLGNQLQIGGGGVGLTSTSAASGRLSDFSSTTNNNCNSSAGTIGIHRLGAGEMQGGACCQATICPATIYRDNLMPKNHQHHAAQVLPNFQAASSSSFDSSPPQLTTSSSLLSCLPQNSGFALNSQSFIGSPLFAVRATTQQHLSTGQQLGELQANHHRSGSSNSGSGSGNNLDGEEEVKLISPVQSISAKLAKLSSATPANNPYNLSQDIYGSQTSTALVSDKHLHRLATSSSSSSGGLTANLMNQQQLSSSRFNATCGPVAHKQKSLVAGATRATTINHLQQQQHQQQHQQQYKPQMPMAQARVAGPILCGQHVGPAYRYTNCGGIGDENTFRQCLHSHRQLPMLDRAGLRAADDLHLLTPSTQLAGPAAMAKFVQFQDGQCLRTHRDTRSIQQAYLSSRQQHQLAANSNNGNNNNNNNLAWSNNQVPPPKNYTNAAALQHNQFHLATKNNASPQVPVTGGYSGDVSVLPVAGNNNAAQQQFGKQFNHQHQEPQHQLQKPLQPGNGGGVMASVNDEIDLMDCGDGEGFNFKYDPKLIKSSSIETLCGAGADDEDDEINFDAFKTNSELIMSLQSCWLAGTNADGQHLTVSSMLSPIPASLVDNQQQDNLVGEQLSSNGTNNSNNQHEIRQSGSILSSLMGTSGNQQVEGHELDHMKKKHDLDELTTALLAELTASLKAQVDLKNKRSGFGAAAAASGSSSCQIGAGTSFNHLPDKSGGVENDHQQQSKQQQHEERVSSEVNQLELINEFDTLLPNNNR